MRYIIEPGQDCMTIRVSKMDGDKIVGWCILKKDTYNIELFDYYNTEEALSRIADEADTKGVRINHARRLINEDGKVSVFYSGRGFFQDKNLGVFDSVEDTIKAVQEHKKTAPLGSHHYKHNGQIYNLY